jgi:hypothetical protein
MKPNRNATVGLLVGTVALAAGLQVSTTRVHADPKQRTFTVDVAVNHATFAIIPSAGLVLAPEPTGPNRGTTFVVDGTIFPGGTLATGAGIGDPNQPGIGRWTCKGVFTSDLGTEDIGFNSTQMFMFDGDSDAIWTEGFEAGLGKIGVVTHRAILGGTGRFQGVSGEAIQEALGTNITGTPNVRLTFRILKH